MFRSEMLKRKICFESLEQRQLLSITLGPDLNKASFVDASGDTINVSLRGPGTADVTLSADTTGDISGITFNGTTDRTNFTITPEDRSTSTTIAGNVVVNGSLRSFSASKADLDGDVTVTGTLGSIKVRDVIGVQTINIQTAGKNTDATFHVANDLLLQSVGAFDAVSAARWFATNASDAGIRATNVRTLSIKGDNGASIAGDLSADINLTATDTTTLRTASIKGGVFNTTWNIAGDARTISIKGDASNFHLTVGDDITSSLAISGALTGDNLLSITDAARSIRLASPVTVAAPQAGPVTQVHVGGKGSVSSRGQKTLKFTNNAVFSNSSISYDLAELQDYSAEGKSWTYQTNFKGGGNNGTVSTTISVSDFSHDDATGRTEATLSTTVDETTTSLNWINDATGTYLTGWTVGTTDGTFDLDFAPLQVSADALHLGQKVQASTDLSGSFTFDNGGTLTGSITGTASSTSRLVEHEQVSTPAGTFLAAKVTIDLTLTGTIDITLEDKVEHVTFKAVQKQTVWLAAGVGPVRNDTSWRITASFPGGGSSTSKFSSQQLLESFTG